MRIELKAHSFDQFAFEGDRKTGVDFDEPSLNLTYEAQTPLRRPISSLDAPIVFDEFNAEVKVVAERSYAHTPLFSNGVVRHAGWSTYGPNGAAFSPGKKAILHGHRWGAGTLEYLRWHTSGAFGALWDNEDLAFDVDMRSGQDSAAWTLGFPGFDIYGHWILDTIPRLHLMQMAEERSGTPLPLVAPSLPRWAGYFLDAAGISPDRVQTLPQNAAISHETLLAPTFPKIGYTLDLDLCRSAWQAWVANAHFSPRGFDQKKIWLSRSRWAVKREIANEDAVEHMMRQRGYTVVHPQELALPEQASLFRSARIIIGQDGSALHNVVFSNPGAAIGVIGLQERRNLWHLGICEALDHRIAYMECDEHGAADPTTLDAMIAALEKTVANA